MKTFYTEEQKRHNPKGFLSSGAPQPNPEKPERIERLLAGARAAGSSIHHPKNYGLGPIAAVHTPENISNSCKTSTGAGSSFPARQRRWSRIFIRSTVPAAIRLLL
jgi:hypothetical protein